MKSKNKGTTTSTYGYQTPPTTQAQQTFDTAIGSTYDAPDESIGYGFGMQRQQLNDSFDNPWDTGNGMSPELEHARKYAGNQAIDQAQGLAYRQDTQQRKAAKLGAYGVSAAAHAPQLPQTGGTSQGYTTQPWGPAAIGAVGQAAGGWLS